MILGDGIRLRAIERSDIPRFVRWLNDPDVTQFLLISSPLSTAMEENWFEKQLQVPPAEGQVLAIEVQSGEEWMPVGNVGLHNVDSIGRSAEFGIFIGEKAYWNQGWGKKATRLMLKHGFENLNLNRIHLHVYENNPRAVKAYETAGFVREGVLRQAVFKNGRYLDLIVMSVLSNEWVNLKEK